MGDYHWSGPARRAFLEGLAETGSVAQAALAAGKSRRAAYNLRFRAEGAVFRLGWDAAILLARAVVEDVLMERVLMGQTIERTRSEDGSYMATTRFDTRLSMALLTRLDRMAEGAAQGDARIITGDFSAFLDLVEAGGTTEDVISFLAARTLEHSDPQCELSQNSDDPGEDVSPVEQDAAVRAAQLSVWFCPYHEAWRTNFPPPPDFEGDEDQAFGEEEYSRALSPAEAHAQDAIAAATAEPVWEAATQARDAWCGFLVDMVA